MKTGQTTSRRIGDDAYFQAGREVSFFVLKENNPFGNTNRFTDELGGSTYTNNIVIDWSTFDGVSVLGYYRLYLPNATWENQIDACLALSVGTFISGWRLWNVLEAVNIGNFELQYAYGYSPFNINGFGGYCHTSTNVGALRCQKIYEQADNFFFNPDPKANVAKGVAVRTFTVTGTTLT